MDIFSILFNMKVCCVYSLELPHRDDSNEYTQYAISNIKTKITLNYPKSAAMGFCSKGLKNEFETAMVNEPSVFEPLKFYCSLKCIESLICFYDHFSKEDCLSGLHSLHFVEYFSKRTYSSEEFALKREFILFFRVGGGGTLLQDRRKQTAWKECTQTPRNSRIM